MKEKKMISIVVPVYCEETMLAETYRRISAVMSNLTEYDYEILFCDDGSYDASEKIISDLADHDPKVKAIILSRNFGYSKNIFYSMQQAKGDAAVLVHCDLQNPPELIPEFIKKWEQGADVVQGVKNKSKENPIMYFFRTVFYVLVNLFFGIKLVKHATDFELCDKSFLEYLRTIKTGNPFLRGLILEYGQNVAYVYYTQEKRELGKSKFNLRKYYDFAIGGIVNMSKCLPRRIICFSLISTAALLAETVYFFVSYRQTLEAPQIENAVICRLAVLLLLLLLIVVSLLFEYIIFLIHSNNVIVVEKRRINY